MIFIKTQDNARNLQLRDQTFMIFTQKGGGGVLKFVTCLPTLLFLNNRSTVHFCGWVVCGRGNKIGHFLWTS